MKFVVTRTLASAAAIMAVAVGVASPVLADPPLLNGTYSGGDVLNLWSIATTVRTHGVHGQRLQQSGLDRPRDLRQRDVELQDHQARRCHLC